MSFSFETDDDFEDSLVPEEGARNKLSSLFSMDSNMSNSSSSSSLQYKPPQAPKKIQLPEQPQILHYSAVQLYKFDNGNYTNVGKVGAAIVANLSNNTFQLLCYRSQKDYVAIAVIRGNSFYFTIQNGQYGSFYDDKRQLWSILFKSSEDAFFFAVNIAIAKFYSNIQDANPFLQPNAASNLNINQVTTVDLQEGTTSPSDGSIVVVESGSKVSLKYTGWLLQQDPQTLLPKLGKTFDSNAQTSKLLRFKVGERSVIQGLEAGILGMKKFGNAKRFIIIPHVLGYGSQNLQGIPPFSTLCFQVEVVPKSKSESSSSSSASSAPRRKTSNAGTPPSLSQSPSPVPSVQQPIQQQQQQQQQQQLTEEQQLRMKVAKYGKATPFTAFQPAEAAPAAAAAREEEAVVVSSFQQVTPTAVAAQSPSPQLQQVVTSSPLLTYATPQTPIQEVPVQQQQQQQQAYVTPVTPVQQQQQQPQVVQQQPAAVQGAADISYLQQQVALLQNLLLSQTQAAALKQQQPAPAVASQAAPQTPVQEQPQPAPQPQAQPAPAAAASAAPELKTILGKLEELHTKVDKLDLVSLMTPKKEQSGSNQLLLSGAALMQNVQHLVQTCEQQQKDLEFERNKVDQLVDKISTLRERNEKYAKEIGAHLSSTNEDAEYLRKELERAQLQIAEERKKYSQLQVVLDREREQFKLQNKELTEEQAEKLTLQKQNDKLQQRLTAEEYNNRQRLIELKQEHEQKITELMTFDKEKQSKVIDELFSERSKVEKLKQMVQEANDKLTALQVDHDAATAKLRADFDAELSDKIAEEQNNLKLQFKQIFQQRIEQVTQQVTDQVTEQVTNEMTEKHAHQIEQFRTLFRERMNQEKDAVPQLVKISLSKVFYKIQHVFDKEKKYRADKFVGALIQLIKRIGASLIELLNQSKTIQEFVESLAEQGNEDSIEYEDLSVSDDEEEEPVLVHQIAPSSPVPVPVLEQPPTPASLQLEPPQSVASPRSPEEEEELKVETEPVVPMIDESEPIVPFTHQPQLPSVEEEDTENPLLQSVTENPLLQSLPPSLPEVIEEVEAENQQSQSEQQQQQEQEPVVEQQEEEQVKQVPVEDAIETQPEEEKQEVEEAKPVEAEEEPKKEEESIASSLEFSFGGEPPQPEDEPEPTQEQSSSSSDPLGGGAAAAEEASTESKPVVVVETEAAPEEEEEEQSTIVGEPLFSAPMPSSTVVEYREEKEVAQQLSPEELEELNKKEREKKKSKVANLFAMDDDFL